MILFIAGILIGYLMDIMIGDPPFLWHPVRLIGGLISGCEKILRKMFPKSAGGEKAAGVLLAAFVPLFCFALSLAVLVGLYMIDIRLWFILHILWSWRVLAAGCLGQECKKVYFALGDLKSARRQLSGLVGRETKSLSGEDIVKATVETAAENTSDGVIAPLFYLLIGGVPLAFYYKAINTLDSMVGYKNKKYINFGRASAKLDDIMNFIPSRIAALLMIIAAPLSGLSARGAGRIFRRDRNKHLSPNAGQTESAAAGALGIRLGGPHVYFGRIVKKPYIGDNTRPAVAVDIKRSVRLMYATSFLGLIFFTALRFFIQFFIESLV